MSPSLRFSILRRDGFTCRYCARRPPAVILEVDHVVPRSAGGSDSEDNLVSACWQCNRGKRDSTGVLPPPGTVKAAQYPVGLFFHVHNFALGWAPSYGLPDVAFQGYVMAVDGDDVWVGTFDWDTGHETVIRSLPRNSWRGWTFFSTSRSMRRAYLGIELRLGLSDQEDLDVFEATPAPLA